MDSSNAGIILNAEKYQECVRFYGELLGLKILFEKNRPDEQLTCFDPEHDRITSGHSAGGIFRHDQESAAGRIGNTVKALDTVMAKKAPARRVALGRASPSLPSSPDASASRFGRRLAACRAQDATEPIRCNPIVL